MAETHINEFDVMFAIHTGVTIMTAKNALFDGCENQDLLFSIPPESETSIIITTPADSAVVIKDIKKEYVTEAKERGFIMIYETEDDEIIRCTPCQLNHTAE